MHQCPGVKANVVNDSIDYLTLSSFWSNCYSTAALLPNIIPGYLKRLVKDKGPGKVVAAGKLV